MRADDATGGRSVAGRRRGMIRARRTPYGLCQQRQYASARMSLDLCERMGLWEPKCLPMGLIFRHDP